jgi:uncharacterized SAM-binding protein YcdF (DUF218 family)
MRGFLVELLNPYPILMLVTGLGLARLWWKRKETRGRLLLAAAPFVILMLLSLEPVEFLALGTLEWKNKPLATRPEDIQAIVVLAGAARPTNPWRLQAELDSASIYRCLCAARLYHQAKACPLFVSGGKSDPSQPGPPCSRVMHDFLLELGVKASDLIVEDGSRTTYENAVESRRLLEARGIQKIVLVTDAVHMVRAAACFRRQGLEVVPAACHHQATSYTFAMQDLVPSAGSLRSSERVWHEWVGLFWYWIQSRI